MACRLGTRGGHPHWHVDDHDSVRQIDVCDDCGHEWNLEQPARPVNLKAILSGACDNVDDASEFSAAAIDDAKPDKLIRPKLVATKITSLGGVDEKRCSSQGLGSRTVSDALKADQQTILVRLHRFDGDAWPGPVVAGEDAANDKTIESVGEGSDDDGALDPMGAPNVANLD